MFAKVLLLAMATQKLQHAADNGEFSAMVKPEECQVLLDRLEELETRRPLLSVVLPDE
jgi:hypothetical protein